MESSTLHAKLVSVGFAVTLLCFASCLGWAQGLPQAPYSDSDALGSRDNGFDSPAANPVAMPRTPGGLSRGSSSLYLSEQMFRDILGPIPNLRIGYLYHFGNRYSSHTRFNLDYLLYSDEELAKTYEASKKREEEERKKREQDEKRRIEIRKADQRIERAKHQLATAQETAARELECALIARKALEG